MNSKDTIESIDTVAVSAKVLSDIIGVSDRRVRQLAEEGILVRSGQGRYILKDSLKNFIVNLKVEASSKMHTAESKCDEVDELNIEKAKHEHVKRQIAELRLALMQGQMHRSEDVEKVMNDMLSNFKQKVLSVPAKLTPILEHRECGFISNTLTTEMNELLMELSNYEPKDFYSDEFICEEFVEEDGGYGV